MDSYKRYHIPTSPAPNRTGHPSRFRVSVDRVKLASLLAREFLEYRGDLDLVLSRPCVYGVFSGPFGGFAPREERCVGCLRCTVQYPDMVRIEKNPDRLQLGDGYITPDMVDTILYEAATGGVPVRGAGYRGAFGGDGWDGLWTDMSEIVRPTRDGIHGREYISTSVDIGGRPRLLFFDHSGRPTQDLPQMHQVQVPIVLDRPIRAARTPLVLSAFGRAAAAAGTLAMVPVEHIDHVDAPTSGLVPVIPAASTTVPAGDFRALVLDGWDNEAYRTLRDAHPSMQIMVRVPFGTDIQDIYSAGVRVLHLTADLHGRTRDGGFVMDAIRHQHEALVEAGIRQRITLIGSGGIVAAEHVPKAIICGLDAVAIDSAALIALQVRFLGDTASDDSADLILPQAPLDWAQQRVQNLLASWRDQLLEVLGAMGLREVRRLRGEMGRAMFQADLEQEAFSSIAGYPHD